MKCKKCGHESKYIESRYIVKDGSFYSNGQHIPENYKGFSHVPCCGKCGEPFNDYLDLSIEEFFNLIKDNSDREVSGKALIRYFHLDELLK